MVEGAEAEAAEAAAAAELEAAPAWRALWSGALEALRREPELNNSRDDVLVQLGASAFLHCPVRHLGERGVCSVLYSYTTHHFTYSYITA